MSIQVLCLFFDWIIIFFNIELYELFHCSTIYNSQDVEATQMPSNRRMEKEDVVCKYTMEYYSAIKKNEILPFAATWMNIENIMLSEISQTEKDSYCMISLTGGI